MPQPEPNQDSIVGRLVALAAAGDMDAMDQLLKQQLPQLRAFVRLQMSPEMRNRESSSDIVQSVCRELMQDGLANFEYRGEAALRRWLCTAALNKIRKKARWHRSRPQQLASEIDYVDYCASVFTPSRIAMGQEQLAQFEAVFDCLPPHYVEVITLARITGMSHAEIAAQTGRTEVAARQLLHRALAALLTALAHAGLGGSTGS